MPITPKKTDSARWAFRSMLGSSLECLETMAYIVDCALVEDDSIAAMRGHIDAEMSALSDWADAYRATFAAVDGVVRTVPALKDEALKTRFAELYNKLGDAAPVTERMLVARFLGDAVAKDPERLEERLMALVEDSKQLVVAREAAKSNADQIDRAARDKAIADALDQRLISPAEAKTMRGVDPATGAENGKPWNRARVDRYVAERAQAGGPIAEIVRMGEVSKVEPQPGKAPTASPSGLIRMGNGGGSGAGLTEDFLAKAAGVDPAMIRSHVEAASALQSADANEAIKRALPR